MTALIVLLASVLAGGIETTAPIAFDTHFTGQTLRFDYYHTGTAGEEHISLDQIRLEGEWPGRRSHLLDDTNLGKYLFVVIDPGTNRALYSTGFSSIYGEWETTGEARSGAWKTLHESQRFPEPRHPVQLVLRKRASDGTFRELYSILVDPESRFVNRAPVPDMGEVWSVFEHGSPAEKVDLLVLGDGYAADELSALHADVRSVSEALFHFPPFSDFRKEFNVWSIDVVSEHSGVSQPRKEFWNESPLGLTYNAFDSERYMLSFSNKDLREIAATAPYDALILIGNSEQYGGGGIYNLYSTAAAKSGQMPYLIVHEFGHAFAGLADEYYTSQVAYEEFVPAGTEPWEPNITALLETTTVKWHDLMEEELPLPTPWNQEAYDNNSLEYQKKRAEMRRKKATEADMDAYFAEVKAATSALLESEPHYGKVGAFEGGGYQAKGLYRPSVDCIMFSRNPDHFCPVCAGAIERVIGMYLGQ